jgi:glycine cleavage system H protein
MDIPGDLRYSKSHEWVRIDGKRATLGITAHAAEELGDIIFIELPEVGREVETEEPFGTVESVKAVSEIYAPLSGKVTAVNESLPDGPELLNTSPYGDGWIAVIELADEGQIDGLLSPQEYAALLEAEE